MPHLFCYVFTVLSCSDLLPKGPIVPFLYSFTFSSVIGVTRIIQFTASSFHFSFKPLDFSKIHILSGTADDKRPSYIITGLARGRL